MNSAFIGPIRDQRPNLFIKTNAVVTKILIDPLSKQAYGVEYAPEDDRYATRRVFATKEVVLSAGTIDSPKLLMLSGIGPLQDLRELGIPTVHNSQGVGENFHDHVTVKPLMGEL